MKLSTLLSVILITSFVCSSLGQGDCCGRPVYRYVSNEEWLGIDDLGMDLNMPNLNENWVDDTTKSDSEALKASENENSTSEESMEDVFPIDLAGRWSMVLGVDASAKNGAFVIGGETGTNGASGSKKYVDLNLYQSGDVIFGWGSMSFEDDVIPIDVSGSIVKERLDLNLMPILGSDLYVMALLFSDDALSGRYYGYNTAGEFWSGTVKGEPN